MDPIGAPAPPSATAAAATTTTYFRSIESNTDSWGEETSLYQSNYGSSAPAPVPAIKLRLMCSYGGHIVPRPHDKSLCYVGGETHMVVVDRHTTLLDLTNRLSKTILRSSSSSSPPAVGFTLKYQLPTEDLDSLISVTTDEDLENMIEEYERLNSSVKSSSRLRLFIFPAKPESVSSIGSFLENSVKSEDWFLNALNGTTSGFSDTSSVNNLLGLDDEISLPEKKEVIHQKSLLNTNFRGNNSGQDVHSIPDSPMMETNSSFGSASSTPSQPNLPPVTGNVDDHQKVGGGAGIEEIFSQISVQQRHHKDQDDGGFVVPPAPVAVSGSPMSSPAITEQSDPFLAYHERSEQGLQMAYLKQQHQFQQKQSTGSILSDMTYQEPVVQIQSSSNNNQEPDQNPRIQIQQQNQNSAYLMSMPPAQPDAQHPQLHHQQQQQVQFIHNPVPQPQYIHHHHPPPPPGAVPMASYYQMYQPPAMDQQNFVYYMPTMQQPPQGYNFPLQQQQQQQHADSSPRAPTNQPPPASNATRTAPKTELPVGVYRTTNSGGGPQLIQVASGHQQQPQYVGFHHPSQSAAAGGGGGNFGYEFADSLQQGQRMYYATQPMPPQSAAQYQATSPIEANLQQSSNNNR